MWLGAELRARRRALVGVALLLGISGGVVLGAAAGGRRTDSAYERFLVAQNAADVTILDDGELGVEIPLDEVVALPQVASYARASLVMYIFGQRAAVASVDDRLGRTINRFRVVEGRMYDSSRVDEAVLGLGVARELGLKVGSTFPLVDSDFDEDLAAAGLENTTITVVGIAAAPGDFPPQHVGLYPSIHLTPALFEKYGNELASGDASNEQLARKGSLFIKLKNGLADLPEFRDGVERLSRGEPVFATTSRDLSLGTKRSFRFQAAGLWFLAAFAAVAMILVGGQTLARQTFLSSADFPTLMALGFKRGGLVFAGITRAAVVGVTSSLVAVLVAIGLSPLTPVGDARYAEPHPGINADATALGIGAVGIVVAAILLAIVPSWRAARIAVATASGAREEALRPSRTASAFARASMPASGVVGARLAFETGRGATAVPVRSTIAAAAFGLAVLVAATTFGTSLNHLVDSPALYGLGWDAFLTHYGDGPDLRTRTEALLALPGLTDVTIGADLPLEVGGEQLFAMGLRKVRGDAGPPIVSGRAPGNDHEIALTSKTARRISADVGDAIAVRIPFEGAPTERFTVVGRTVIPPFGFVDADPGEGALLTIEGALRLVPSDIEVSRLVSDAFVRLQPGARRQDVIASAAPVFDREPDEFGEGPRDTPADVISFGRVENLPLVLGATLGVVAALALVHTISSSVRRRRNDLAILKTLGFERRQLRAAVAWQASALAIASAAIAIPAGIALGRWTWQLLADQIGVVPKAVVPGVTVALVVPAAVVLANLFAAIPGGSAARLHPARVLRAE